MREGTLDRPAVATPPGWRPLLLDEEATRASRIALDIADELANDESNARASDASVVGELVGDV